MINEMWKRRLIFVLLLCVLTFSLGPPLAIAEEGTAADPVLTTPPPEPILHQFHLVAGWNLISLPFVTDPSPLVVFAELPQPWFLAEYDAVEHSYHPYTQVSLRPGVGYWLRVPEAVNFTLQGTSVTLRNAYPLVEGWNMVGYPFPVEVSWDSVARAKVERGGETYSLQEAFDTGILSADIYSWRENGYFSVKNELRKFSPGYGYWIKLNSLPTMDGFAAEPVSLVFEPGGIFTDIASKLLEAAYEGVKEGAADWAKEKACGWVTSLLTGSKGESAQVLDRLNQMEGQLQDIQASLARIEGDFSQLFAQLKQMQAQIIDTILNAQVKGYINTIDTHYNTTSPEGLAYFTKGKTPTTPGIVDKVNQFCTNVINSWDIPNCVNGIHLAIIPPGGSAGLLDSWLSANILTNTATWTFQPQRLMDYYLAYESYFAGLLFYEYRGVQIYTEALNHRDPTGGDAKEYLNDTYTPNLSSEVDRFLIGAARLVAYSANLTATSTTDPLFLGGQDVLSRAQFFAIQTRDEGTFGLRTAILTTADALKPTGNPTPLVTLANSSKGLSWNSPSTILRVPNGPAYDHWDTTNSPTFSAFLGPSTDWLLLLGNYGPALPQYVGNGWSAQLTDSLLAAPVSPAFSVGTYTDGYQPSTTGTILYGLGLAWARLGGPQQFAANYPGGGANPSWVVNSNSVSNRTSGSGITQLVTNDGLSNRALSPGFTFSANSNSGKYKSWVSGYIQDARNFTYQGMNPVTAVFRVTFQADVYFGNNNAGYSTLKLYAWRGLYDWTAAAYVPNTYTNWNFWNPDIMKHDLQFGTNGVITQDLSAALTPGHSYGWIIGVQSDTTMYAANDPQSVGLVVRNMRANLYLKGVTIRFP